MVEVFGNSSEGNPLTIPIVPTMGNNDIFPHNIMQPGPSKLTKEYVELWKRFIPEDQYHIFHKGAYFWQQVVPGRNGKWGRASEGGLAVFSLNTLWVLLLHNQCLC
jgi:endopolyphosphatase